MKRFRPITWMTWRKDAVLSFLLEVLIIGIILLVSTWTALRFT